MPTPHPGRRKGATRTRILTLAGAAVLAGATLLPTTAASAAQPAPSGAPSGTAAARTASSTAAQAATTPAATASICDIYCDTRDPALATSDRVPVTATTSNRTISLHLSDNDVMGWAAIDNGGAGDEVWLDRSFDGGTTWASGSKLGDTRTPSGAGGWRTLMYNVDDWNNTGVGALRACGQAAGSTAIACTQWARVNRNAWSPSTAAATALMATWDRSTGLFGGNGWWTAANAMTAVIGNIRSSGMPSYTYVVARTYDAQVNAAEGQFRNDYLDDTGWWGLAWVAAYDLTGDSRYLNTARADADHMAAYWNGTCGGGVQWNETNPYKNAITNELYLWLNAALHNRIPGDSAYLGRARAEWSWFAASGMINSSHLINDGLSGGSCTNNGQPTYTYNQGVVLGGLTELYRATGDSGLLGTARTLADASTTASAVNSGGILREPNESDACDNDGAAFKGAYVRGLQALNAQLSDHPYSGYIDRQAAAARAHDRTPFDAYGPHWNGPLTASGYSCTQSALDMLDAAESD